MKLAGRTTSNPLIDHPASSPRSALVGCKSHCLAPRGQTCRGSRWSISQRASQTYPLHLHQLHHSSQHLAHRFPLLSPLLLNLHIISSILPAILTSPILNIRQLSSLSSTRCLPIHTTLLLLSSHGLMALKAPLLVLLIIINSLLLYLVTAMQSLPLLAHPCIPWSITLCTTYHRLTMSTADQGIRSPPSHGATLQAHPPTRTIISTISRMHTTLRSHITLTLLSDSHRQLSKSLQYWQRRARSDRGPPHSPTRSRQRSAPQGQRSAIAAQQARPKSLRRMARQRPSSNAAASVTAT